MEWGGRKKVGQVRWEVGRDGVASGGRGGEVEGEVHFDRKS